MNNVYLKHNGVKNQRWGVRRYQNYDGTLTALGRSRLGLKPESKSKTKAESKTKTKTKTKAKTKTKTKTKTKSDPKQEKKKTAEEKNNTLAEKRQRKKDYKNRRTLSDTELQSRITRLEKEAKYADLVSADVSPAKKFVKTILNDATKPVATNIVKTLAEYGTYHVTAGLKEIDRDKLTSYLESNFGKNSKKDKK